MLRATSLGIRRRGHIQTVGGAHIKTLTSIWLHMAYTATHILLLSGRPARRSSGTSFEERVWWHYESEMRRSGAIDLSDAVPCCLASGGVGHNSSQ